MSGKILEGNLNLSDEHEGYAWVFFKNLTEYELADWLQEFVMNQTRIVNNHKEIVNYEKEPKNSIKPWLNSIQSSMDRILKR